jgi:chemotaxis protein methyltransferase CheR
VIEDVQITNADFAAIATILRDAAGIKLTDNKRSLVTGRLGKRLRALGLPDFSSYVIYLKSPRGKTEHGELVNALTTNLTSFFRESHHLVFLRDTVLPSLLAESQSKRIRLWSAACSSGEEPYSMAMILHKAMAAKPGWDARILATDIDTNMVETARNGLYDEQRAASIPPEFAGLTTKMSDGQTMMSAALKDRITFNSLNLLSDWPMRGKFDAVFCRNVVIYFDKDTQRILFNRIADAMAPRSWLFIGHSESLFKVSDRFENLGRTIYRKLQ